MKRETPDLADAWATLYFSEHFRAYPTAPLNQCHILKYRSQHIKMLYFKFFIKNIEHTMSDPNILHLILASYHLFYTIIIAFFTNNIIYFIK